MSTTLKRALVLAMFADIAGIGQSQSKTQPAMKLEITSTAFQQGTPIPARFTCDGEDVSPPLKWTGAPPETKSFALICDDPDAPIGTWVHWVLWNLPASAASLPQGAEKTNQLPAGTAQGANDFKRTVYGGPCPPGSKPHHYFFKLFALDTTLSLKPGSKKKDLLKAIEGHVLAQGELMGTYTRQR